MSNYEVTQRLLSVASRYDVREQGQEAIVMTVKGALMSPTPSFTLVEGVDGKELGSLKGNFAKTKFRVVDAAGADVAAIEFPAIALKKTMTLRVGDRTFAADGGVFTETFKCSDANGVALEVVKDEGLTKVRDHFVVKLGEPISKEIGLLAAVAIHSRFFEMI